MKALARQLLTYTASPVMRALRRHQATILMFHGFTDRQHTGCENSQHKHLHVAKFETFLRFLKRHYQIISLDALVSDQPVPKRAVVLTFDDGFLSNYTLAYPLLKRYEAPAIIYLATEFVDGHRPIWTDRVDYALHAAGKTLADLRAAKQRLKALPQEQIDSAVAELEAELGHRLINTNDPSIPAIFRTLSWEQVREMQASDLVQFGAHTHTHKILGRCQPETVEWELAQSKAIIERHTGRPCHHFCYPNGWHGDFTETTEQFLAAAGFRTSTTTINGTVRTGQSPYLMPRLGITNDLDLPRFDLILSGCAGR